MSSVFNGQCGSLNVIGPHNSERRGTIRRCGLGGVSCPICETHSPVKVRASRTEPRDWINILGVEQTHTERPGSFTQRVNGSFIKHKSGIYTWGQKDESPLPSGTGKEGARRPAPPAREQLWFRQIRRCGGNLACRWNYHNKRGPSSLHSEQRSQEVRGKTALHSTSKEGEKTRVPTQYCLSN